VLVTLAVRGGQGVYKGLDRDAVGWRSSEEGQDKGLKERLVCCGVCVEVKGLETFFYVRDRYEACLIAIIEAERSIDLIGR
jgi:hypothetical protein